MNYQIGEYNVDTGRFRILCSGEPVDVEPLVFDLIVFLVENRDRVISRSELLDSLWPGKVVTDEALTTCQFSPI